MYMKSCRAFLFALFSLFCININAQLFVGGNFSVNASGGSFDNGTTKTDKPSSFAFDLSPQIGYFLSDTIAVGFGLDFTYNKSKFPGNPETISRSSSIGFIPFIRYYAIKLNKFSIYGQGNIGLSFSRSSTKEGSTTTDGPKTTSLSINIFPGLAYDLTDKLSLETSLNFLNFGYYNSTTKEGSIKNHSSSFNFGAGLNNIVQVGNISIGAIYKF